MDCGHHLSANLLKWLKILRLIQCRYPDLRNGWTRNIAGKKVVKSIYEWKRKLRIPNSVWNMDLIWDDSINFGMMILFSNAGTLGQSGSTWICNSESVIQVHHMNLLACSERKQKYHPHLVLPPARLWAESHCQGPTKRPKPLVQPKAQNGSASWMVWPLTALGRPSRFQVAISGIKPCTAFLLFPLPLTHPTISESRQALGGLSGLVRGPRGAAWALKALLLVRTSFLHRFLSYPAQTSACCSSTLYFTRSIRFQSPLPSYCPDELQELVWLSFQPGLPSHPAQTSACCSSGLSFYWIIPLHLRHHLIAQTSYKRSSGYLFNKAFTSTSPSFPTTSLHLIQPRRAQTLVWLSFFFLTRPLSPPLHPFSPPPSISFSPDELQALIWAILFASNIQFNPPCNFNEPKPVFITRLGYLFTGSLLLPHPVKTSYKHSSHYLFSAWPLPPPPFPSRVPVEQCVPSSTTCFLSSPFVSTFKLLGTIPVVI